MRFVENQLAEFSESPYEIRQYEVTDYREVRNLREKSRGGKLPAGAAMIASEALIRLKVLTKVSSEYGRYSSYYTNFSNFGPKDNIEVKMFAPRPGWLPRSIGKLYSLALDAGPRDRSAACAELEFRAAVALDGGSLGHIANIEDHLRLINGLRSPKRRWIATMHFPPSRWREDDAKALRHFAHAITLCQRDADYLAQWMPRERISCILHGVDTGFFSPGEGARSASPRIIFVGKWLRDFETAGIVLKQALEKWPALTADIVVAMKWAEKTQLGDLAAHPRIRWHENIDDEKLLQLYREAWILFLPLLETSANNALVEAMACGTTPVVNLVGGVPDYGGGSVFPTTLGSRPEDYLAMIGNYLDKPSQLTALGEACRKFTIDYLSWDLVRAEHRRVYETVAKAIKSA